MNKLILEFDKVAKGTKILPKNITLYYILKDNHCYLRNGTLKSGFSKPLTISSKLSRDSLLSTYSTMEFIFDELIRILVLDPKDNDQSKRLYYLLSLIPVNRKIRLFLDWKVFDPITARKFSRLFEVKNSLVHSVRVEDVVYRPKTSLSLGKNLSKKKYQKDLLGGWNTLCKIYQKHQDQISWEDLLAEIKNYKTKSKHS